MSDSIDKGIKVSDALENATEIIANYEGPDKDKLSFKDIYTWDDDL